ncbi:amidohydrolase family protein [Chiayiivirga flava]|uniref:Imidazolonepropionase-like amidohydrolase n=1 Tax=Chiayiivirga flava TaxID=659595 RepID=A0A7W8D4P8_9GAMM|nr:amidohydrolase family protein [Chiayiivirga flava]MBB5207883.1 imidazolonepropionase-like amidohydrolase [Chiayiivirga flava]
MYLHRFARTAFAAAALVFGSTAAAQDVAPWRAEFLTVDAPKVLLTHARVIDGTGKAPADGVSILIENGVIAAVGAELQAPDGAHVVALDGRTVMPGLVMLHEHMMYFSGRAVWHAQPVSYPKLYLAAGVTTLRTGGAEHPEVDRNLKRRIDAGLAPGPSMHLTGPYFNGAAGDFLGDTVLASPDEGRAAAAFWASRGFTSLKLYDAVDAPLAQAVIDEAHRHGVKVTGHLRDLGCAEAARLGIDSIEHAFLSCAKDLGFAPNVAGFVAQPDDPRVRALIRTLVDEDVVLVATPAAIGRPLGDEALSMLAPQAREAFDATTKAMPPWLPDEAGLRELRKLERAFVEAGGRLGIGADAMDFGLVAGYADHRALELLVEDGWTPMEVIRMATSNGAALLGIGDRTGRIAPGYRADLIVTRDDPSKDIRALQWIDIVFKDGAGYDPAKLRAAAKGKVGWH